MNILLGIFLLNLLVNEVSNSEICQTGEDVSSFKECANKSTSQNSICCFFHYSYLGAHAKYCMEFPKIDIEHNKVKNTIDMIEQGKYWPEKIQSYDVHSIECDGLFHPGRSYGYYIFFLMLLFFTI